MSADQVRSNITKAAALVDSALAVPSSNELTGEMVSSYLAEGVSQEDLLGELITLATILSVRLERVTGVPGRDELQDITSIFGES